MHSKDKAAAMTLLKLVGGAVVGCLVSLSLPHIASGVGQGSNSLTKWWNDTPSNFSELAISINERLDDKSSWTLRRGDETATISCGKLTFNCPDINSNSGVFYFDGKNIGNTLESYEKMYLNKKANKIYKTLRVKHAVNLINEENVSR